MPCELWVFPIDLCARPFLGFFDVCTHCYIYFIIYLFWLQWVLMLLCGLSSCGEQGHSLVVLHRLLIVEAFAPGARTSVLQHLGVVCTGLVAPQHGIFPRPEELMSPALLVGFLPTGQIRKSQGLYLLYLWYHFDSSINTIFQWQRRIKHDISALWHAWQTWVMVPLVEMRVTGGCLS